MTKDKFNRWVNTQLRECKRVTGISKEDVEHAVFVHFPEVKAKRNIEHGVFGSDNNDAFCIVIFDNNNKLRLFNVETGKSGLARKHPHDEPNYGIGLAVAWANYCDIEIPELDEDIPVHKVTPCVNPKCFKPGTIILDRKLDLKYIYVSDYEEDSMVVKYYNNPESLTVIPKTDKDYKIVGKIKLEV